MKLDAKFHGVVVKNKDQSIVPQDQWMVFLAKDNAVPATLAFYEEECRRQGAKEDQIYAIQQMRKRVEDWRMQHLELCKVADVQTGELQ